MTTARAVFRLQTPSGGDWAVERVAALQLRWTEGASITRNHFHHLDGTALLLSGANSGAKIIGNEFAWTGQSAIGPPERDCVVWLRMSPRIHSVGVCIYTLGVLGSAQPLPSSYIPPSYILPPPAAASPAGPPAGRRILVDKRIRRLPELRPARKRSFLSLPMFVPSLS